MITLNKLPKPDDLKKACLNLDEKLINQDHINAMLRIFPPPDVIQGLIEEAANTPEDEKWDKGEEYFLQVIDFKSLRQRLVVWQFKLDFPEKRDIVAKVQIAYENAFQELRSNSWLKKIFGYILAFGNIMNGGTARGQADGFYLEALSKVTTTKDINNRTMMQIICDRLKQEDEDFLNIKNSFKNVYFVAAYSLKDEDNKLKEILDNFNKAKGNFDQVEKLLAGAPYDEYCSQMKVFVTSAQAEIKQLEDRCANIKKTFAESCEYYLIDKGDEKASNSMEFFKFFTGFVDSIMKSMPKEEKKKKEAPAAAGGAKKFSDGPASGGAGGPGAGLKNNLMAELKMKQQADQK